MLRQGWLILAALMVASPIWAQDEPDNRWYVSPLVGGVVSDQSDYDSGIAAYITAGRPLSQWLTLEFEGHYAKIDVDDLTSDNDYEKYGVGVSALLFPLGANGSLKPYLIAGIAGQGISFLQEDTGSLGLTAGGGMIQQLSNHWDFRVDLRYALDMVAGQGVVEDDTFYNWIGTVGFRYRIGTWPNDSDRDGVPDSADACPNTPRGVAVGPNGCPLDGDGDGVLDKDDRCPDTPPGVPVGADGCERDSDGDGVPDSLDKCPNTPAGAAVDAEGCPRDSDGDGVPDYADKCPNTPAGVQVDARGCPFVDKDGDGIPDAQDNCPDTPAGVPVGEDGCPLDSDGDGVPDYMDECPKTPAGLAVLPNGCALKGDKRLARPGEAADADGFALDRDFILHGVVFEFDSARLTAEAKRILDDVAVTMEAYPDVKVDVEGHTDATGTDGYNQALSEKRSLAVVDYLVSKGVAGSMMTPVGYGESRPIASNATEEGRGENRRVVFRVTDEGS